MKIKSVQLNNRRRLFEIEMGNRSLTFPYAKLSVVPSKGNLVEKVWVDPDFGKETFEKYTQSPENFDLIFMDIQMPKMNGMEATKAIRQYEEQHSSRLERVPIIALTANAMKGDRETYLKAGMNDYIAKPIKRELVFESIEK